MTPRYAALRLALLRSAVICAAAEPDRRVVGTRHRTLEGGATVGFHHAADIRRPHAVQRRERPRGVTGLQLGVRVHAHDRRIAGGADRAVQPDGDVGFRIVDQHDALVGSEFAGQLGGPVGRGSKREDQLGRTCDILREHGLDGPPQVGPLVQHRHHEAHPGAFGDDRRILASRLVDMHPSIMSWGPSVS